MLERQGLEAVLIGNAAAALQGAPVTTVDLDFMFRRTPANVKKLTAVAAELGAMLMKPYYPASGLLRISRDEDGLQLDFMGEIHGVRSFEGLKSRAREMRVGETRVRVASWLISSRARRRRTGPAIEPCFRYWRKPLKKKVRITRKDRLEALKKESELQERDLIRRLQALPIEKRGNFLRQRVGIRASTI
ncbi:MAG: hypothetical protein JWP63_3406 [Candidatus Solibacter sp.]|nr:hypothetical protein [Candidatus Solibacter sp.]